MSLLDTLGLSKPRLRELGKEAGSSAAEGAIERAEGIAPIAALGLFVVIALGVWAGRKL